jgi:signal transduction histidine kinase
MKISAPFSSLNKHLKSIAERDFGTKLQIPVDDELQEFVNNINLLSEKLQSYDKAQRTFLQNASHEFRTPLMSIQSYAEGIKYDVVDSDTATDIIIDETKRMTHLIEELLYLSRLDTIEESYRFRNLDFDLFLTDCVARMKGISSSNNIGITSEVPNEKIIIYADEEKLSRGISNIISNCIRYAESYIKVSAEITDSDTIRITISDDGPGFQGGDLSHLFERFYKGKKGNCGLGLAISKTVIERHNGKVTAENTDSGAQFVIRLPISHTHYIEP